MILPPINPASNHGSYYYDANSFPYFHNFHRKLLKIYVLRGRRGYPSRLFFPRPARAVSPSEARRYLFSKYFRAVFRIFHKREKEEKSGSAVRSAFGGNGMERGWGGMRAGFAFGFFGDGIYLHTK